MYKLKNLVRRGSALLGAAGLLAGVGSSAIPAFVSADALNPLTERSLTLSSSSPGWSYTDGSGNSTYAGPNTGANGKKTGNFFSFRTSSDETVKAFTFQYCTTPAGECLAPGNDGWTDNSGTYTRNGDDVATGKSDLQIVTSDASAATPTAPAEVAGSDYKTLSADGAATNTGGTTADYGNVTQAPDAQDDVSPYDQSALGNADDSNGIAGNFVVLYGNSATGFVNTYSGDWDMSVSNQEETGTVAAGTATGKNNMITITNSTGIHLHPGDYVKIMFFGTDSNYITNPGQGAFFVKINDFSDEAATTLVDGGVTVANVMNQSIQIQTKVLETMDFSVGTVDPDTLTAAELSSATSGSRTAHGQCDPILGGLSTTGPQNVLKMGNPSAEYSLDTTHTYATHSYWRLSSNSSGGAVVYYAGNTLSNTEGDLIDPITSGAAPLTGTEQFGLGLDNGTSGDYAVNYDYATADASVPMEYGVGAGGATTSNDAGLASDWDHTDFADGHDPQLAPLAPVGDYGGATGGINLIDPDGSGPNPPTETIGTTFAYDPNSQTVPAPIASEDTEVVDCVTGKMRYIANIAATTPAGIYTTKINYIASPEY